MSVTEARESAQPSRKMVAEAAAWITRLHGSNRSPEVEAGFRAWLAAEAGHARAFESMTEIWDTMPAMSASQLPRVAAWPEPAGRKSSWVRAAAVIAGCAVGLALVLSYMLRHPSYVTDIGEQRIVNLDDGSRVFLNSKTRMAIHYGERERRIVLSDGEVFFDVAQDARRPFTVIAGTHRVTALGTSFIVRYEGGHAAVTLLDGRVSVTELPASSTPLLLTPGERITFAAGAAPKLDRPRLESVAAWRRGELIFDYTPLADAVAEVNRHDKTQLVIDDLTLRALPVSGIYRTGDSPGFARMVARMYGVDSVQEHGRVHLRR